MKLQPQYVAKVTNIAGEHMHLRPCDTLDEVYALLTRVMQLGDRAELSTHFILVDEPAAPAETTTAPAAPAAPAETTTAPAAPAAPAETTTAPAAPAETPTATTAPAAPAEAPTAPAAPVTNGQGGEGV